MKRIVAILAVLYIGVVGWALPQGYGGLSLGMSLDQVKGVLNDSEDFGYDSERDVSLMPGGKRTLIETDASRLMYSFFLRTYLQFVDDKLYVITIDLKPSMVDYYSVLSSLETKYGEPSDFSPSVVSWEDDNTSLSLERPLTLRYIDKKTSNDLKDKAHVNETVAGKQAQDFLDSL